MSKEFIQQLKRLQEELEELSLGASTISTEAEGIEFQGKIEIKADEMALVAEAWREHEMSQHGFTEVPKEGKILVQLTPRQRQLVRDEAGIEMDVLEIIGSTSWLTSMPQAAPQQMDRLILLEAHRRVERKKTRQELRIQLEEMAASDNDAVRTHVQNLMVDPDFAGGILLDDD